MALSPGSDTDELDNRRPAVSLSVSPSVKLGQEESLPQRAVHICKAGRTVLGTSAALQGGTLDYVSKLYMLLGYAESS